MDKKLELRMMGLVPYNISPIQQAIQFGHAVVEYGQKIKKFEALLNITEYKESLIAQYNDWADNWKTFIILNGGTTNHKKSSETGLPNGSLNNHLMTLANLDVEFASFCEPDLGDQLTAIVFIVDERVFNKKDYPDFEDWVILNHIESIIKVEGKSVYQSVKYIKDSTNAEDQKLYKSWVNFVGGDKNVFLRDFLKTFRLA